MSTSPWAILGIAPTNDTKRIRSAYATKIKSIDIDSDVERYTALRQARDLALRLAKQDIPLHPIQDEPDAPEQHSLGTNLSSVHQSDGLPNTSLSMAQGTYAPPNLNLEHIEPSIQSKIAHPDNALSTSSATPLSPSFLQRDTKVQGQLGINAPHSPNAEAWPAWHLNTDGIASKIDLNSLQSPFIRIVTVLVPQDSQTSRHLSKEEQEESIALLQQMLTVIDGASIDRQGELENWLASLLAKTWPRSAPLVVTASKAFNWGQEWNRFDSRPAIQFLGQRLRSYTFQQGLQNKGHPFHKAWIELSRSGPCTITSLLRVSPMRILGLLRGIRKHYPDLETELNAERIASWEKYSSWISSAVVILSLLLLALCVSLISTEPTPAPEPALVPNSNGSIDTTSIV